MGKAARHRGTTPAWARARRAGALLAGGLLLAGALTPAAVATTPASRTAPAGQHQQPQKRQKQNSDDRTVRVALNEMSPAVPTENGTVTLTGTVTNTGRSTVTDAHVGVRVGLNGQPMASRSHLAEIAQRTDFTYDDGDEIPDRVADLPSLSPGVSHPFTLQVPVKELNLRGNGVYQLGVSLTGETKKTSGPQVLGIVRTFVPWYPDPNQTKHTQVTMVWPVIDRPHMDARTDADTRRTPVLRDDRLAADLAPGGRLGQLVSVGKDLPVTWVVDPDLLATVDTMADGYKVAADDVSIQDAEPGTGSEVAARWLNEFRAAVRGKQVIALPFADPDLASIAHRGKNVPETLVHLDSAHQLAVETTRTVLGVEPRTDVAWPMDGAADRSVVNVARATKADTVIVNSSALGSGSMDRTPDSPRPLGGGATALVADSALSTAFDGDNAVAGESTLAVQQFLAQSLMITMEAPSSKRSILVAPQRWPTASAAQTMAKALVEGRDGGWITPVDLRTLERAAPDKGADRTLPPASEYPGRLRKQELSTATFGQIRDTQDSLRGFLQILSRKDRADTPFSNAVLRSMSNSWRTDAAAGRAYRASLQEHLSGLRNAVRIRDKSDVTLSGSSGTLQVTVENNLNQKVENLVLELRSTQKQRFTVGQAQKVTIDGRHRKSFEFPTSAHANGRATVVAQLLTEDGVPYGEPVTFQVNVTSVTGTVLIVIACGVLLLILAGARMYRQRKRAALQDGTGADHDGAAEDAEDAVPHEEAEDDAARGAVDGGDRGPFDDGGEPTGDVPHGAGWPEPAGTPGWEPGAARERRSGDPGPDTADGDPVPDAADEKVER